MKDKFKRLESKFLPATSESEQKKIMFWRRILYTTIIPIQVPVKAQRKDKFTGLESKFLNVRI